MSTELLELVGFLHSPQPAVRQIALDNLVGYSQGLYAHIFKTDDYQAVKDLKKLVRETGPTTVGQALTILVNLCDNETILDSLASDESLIEFVANQICNIKQRHADLFCILLANLAKKDQITSIFKMKYTPPPAPESADKDAKPEAPPFTPGSKVIDCLMDCFVKGSDRSFNKFANFDYLAYFFADLSRFKQGRDYFITLEDDGYPITKLLVFTEIESNIRRSGVASTIKNCLFDIPSHEKFIFDESINLLPYILLPLAGSEEIPEDEMFELPDELQLLPEDKKRDSSPQILTTYVECLLLLSTTKKVRQYLRDKSVYSIIRELHKNVEIDEVQDPCERLVQVLMRDDAHDIEDSHHTGSDDEEEDDDIIEVL